MTKAGIICDITYTRHHLFRSYYYSIKNLYGKVKLVNSISDLQDVDILFIGDDHYGPHKQIWMTALFRDYCNGNGVHVVFLTNERILNSFFPWNEEIYAQSCGFKYRTHYANDINDCKQLGMEVNRTAMSMALKFKDEFVNKKDKMVFVGSSTCRSYKERANVLKDIKKVIDVDIITDDIPMWDDYIKLIAGYRFVFSPIGNGNFFPMRFYEALAVHSIPVHQVRSDTLDYYKVEKKFDDCIFFESVKEVKDKLYNFTLSRSHNVLWMEDNLMDLLIKDKLLR